MEHITIDTLGPVSSPHGGPKYVIAIINTFNRFAELYSATSTTAVEAVKAITAWAGRYGAPLRITSDGGSQYRNALMESRADAARFEHHITTAHHPQSNGRIERLNRDIGKHLRAVTTLGEDWHEHLPTVQFIINNTPKGHVYEHRRERKICLYSGNTPCGTLPTSSASSQ